MKRSERQNTLLIIVRNIWHMKVDGLLPCSKTANKEIMRLLKLSKSTVDDL